jgi:signal transduction histidine kinase
MLVLIEDTGIGMSDEFKRRIFKPFERDNLVRISKEVGSGLGLDISRSLARKLGGDLVLEWTKVGVGSRFRFAIPSQGSNVAFLPMQNNK